MYSAADINDDGMVVGTGEHGSEAVGFWMAPHGIAHELSGTVYGPDGVPVAGARVRISDGGGEAASPTTDADGTYEATLLRGSYEITVLPDGDYLPTASPAARSSAPPAGSASPATEPWTSTG